MFREAATSRSFCLAACDKPPNSLLHPVSQDRNHEFLAEIREWIFAEVLGPKWRIIRPYLRVGRAASAVWTVTLCTGTQSSRNLAVFLREKFHFFFR